MSAIPSMIEQGIEAHRIVKVSDGNTGYYTFVGIFSEGDSTKAMIKRIWEPDENQTDIDYPNGCGDFIFDWSLRLTYNYSPRKN